MRTSENRGAVLIMSMMAICLAFMMIYALIQTSGIGLRDSVSIYEREAAFMAAQSGLDYAVTRLQKNPGWRGDSNSQYWNGKYIDEKTYGKEDSLFVSESNGSVVGLIRRHSGNISVFRIKFNYEDNSDATYNNVVRSRFGQPNSDNYYPKYEISFPFVSINNLQGSVQVPVYRAKPNGKGLAAITKKLEYNAETGGMTTDDAIAFHLQPKRVYLVVEGLSGVGLRDCGDLANANEIANTSDKVIRRYIEACYSSTPPVLQGDAAFANGDISVKVQDKLLVSTKTVKASSLSSDVNVTDDFGTCPSPGSLRSNTGNISVLGSKKLNTFNGKLVLPADKSVSYDPDLSLYVFMNSKGRYQPMAFPLTSREVAETEVDKVEWKDVGKAEDIPGNQLKSGFYQWQRIPNGNPDQPRYSLLFYPDGYELDNKGRPIPKKASNYQIAVTGEVSSEDTVEYGGKTVSLVSMGPADKIIFDKDDIGIKTPTITMLGNIYCNGELAIGSNVSQVFQDCPSVKMQPYSNGNESQNGILTVKDSVYIASSVTGSGSIVTENDITLLGNSVITSGDTGVAIYGNNVNLKSLDLTPISTDLLENDVSGINNENMTFGRELWEMLDASWHAHENTVSTYPDPDDLKEYLREALGIRADSNGYMSSCNPEFEGETTRVYRFPVYLRDSCGNIKAKYYFDCHSSGIYINNSGHSSIEGPVNALGDTIPIPESVRLPNYNNKSKNMKDHVDAFDSLCYGDQIFNGIIYAKNNFTANLGKQFHLTVNGSIRVGEGSINVEDCKGANFNYDETYIRQLLPGYSALHRTMWNCW
ncbi:MAG: hypothetical protein Q4F00_06970 [bacterium]|nr:hypothetical protein [bacterium]